MDMLKTISRRNFFGKLLNASALGILLLPIPPILVHARRGRIRHHEEGWQYEPRIKFSFDFPSKTAVNMAVRLRMDMICETDEPLYGVRVRLQAPEGADLVGGEDSWSGNLKRDDRVGFEALYEFRNPGVYKFQYTIEGSSDAGDFSKVRPISIIVVE